MWYKVDEQTRGHIKEALFAMLGNENRETLKNASICLGIIAAIEVPDGLWSDFMQQMSDNSTNPNLQYRFASV